jgi:hypothetical protein
LRGEKRSQRVRLLTSTRHSSLEFQVEARFLRKTIFRFLAPAASSNFPPPLGVFDFGVEALPHLWRELGSPYRKAAIGESDLRCTFEIGAGFVESHGRAALVFAGMIARIETTSPFPWIGIRFTA